MCHYLFRCIKIEKVYWLNHQKVRNKPNFKSLVRKNNILRRRCRLLSLFKVKIDKHFVAEVWSSGRALGSRSEGRGFDPCPIQC